MQIPPCLATSVTGGVFWVGDIDEAELLEVKLYMGKKVQPSMLMSSFPCS